MSAVVATIFKCLLWAYVLCMREKILSSQLPKVKVYFFIITAILTAIVANLDSLLSKSHNVYFISQPSFNTRFIKSRHFRASIRTIGLSYLTSILPYI